MSKKSVTVNGFEISVGDVFVNDSNGGQEVTVLAVDGDPIYGNIRYELHEASRFNSKEFSSTDEEIFVASFRKKRVNKMKNVTIKFEDGGFGEYGLHDGFFNFLAVIEDKEYSVQCCADSLDQFDVLESGYDEGVCRDVNAEIVSVIDEYDGWDMLAELIELAVIKYENNRIQFLS